MGAGVMAAERPSAVGPATNQSHGRLESASQHSRSDGGRAEMPALEAGQSFLYVVAVASAPICVRVAWYSKRLNKLTDDWAAAEPAKRAR